MSQTISPAVPAVDRIKTIDETKFAKHYGSRQPSEAVASPIDIRCSVCNSGDVRRDACAAWNPERQTWELATVYDNATCCVCDDDATLIEVPLRAA